MRILVDVYDATGVFRLGEGPLTTCQEAKAARKLDGAGTIALTFPATDRRARELLQNERRVRIPVEEETPQGEELRELGRGVIREKGVDVAEGGASLTWSGPDSLDALTRRSVRLNRQYANQTLAFIASDLIALVPGWSVVVEAQYASLLQSARFAGASVLKCLLRLAAERGLHLREHPTQPNTVELGEFGAVSSLVITNIENLTREAHAQRDLIFIDHIKEGESTREVINRVFPLGAGEGQAALTLRDSTRDGTYEIHSLLDADGSTVYYLEDQESMDRYGVIEKPVTFKQIGPISNSGSAKVLAANALYDAAVAFLRRASQSQKTYKVSGVKCQQRLNAGDKVRIVYKGEVFADGVAVDVLDVDDLFWVLEVTERVADGGQSFDLAVSLVDRVAKDAVGAIIEGLEAIEVRNLTIATFPMFYTDTWTDTVECHIGNTGRDANFVFRPQTLLTDITKVLLVFRTFPLSTPVGVSALFGSVGTSTDYYYNISDSDQYPRGLRLFINDVEVSEQFGGPWNPTLIEPFGTPSVNAQIDQSLDITEIVRAGGLGQEYLFRFRATFDPFGPGNRVPGYGAGGGVGSSGFVQCGVRVLGAAQAILPEV